MAFGIVIAMLVVVAVSMTRIHQHARPLRHALGVSHRVVQVSTIFSQISAASSEQTSGIEPVNTAMIEIDDVTRQNAALVEQAAAAAQSLREQAEGLSQLVGVFKLNGVLALGANWRT